MLYNTVHTNVRFADVSASSGVVSFRLTFLLSRRSFIVYLFIYLFILPFLPIEKRFTYDAEFKRKVILCAEQVGAHAAVRMLRMSEAIVRRWRGTKTNCFLARKVQCHILAQEEQDVLKLMPLL